MNDLLQAIANADSIAIGGHIRPDGDCVGSCMGLCNYIWDNYPQKKVTVYLGEYASAFSFIHGMEQCVVCYTQEEVQQACETAACVDLFIALDSSNTERLEFYPVFEKAKKTLCIDHHVTNEQYAMQNLVYDASSTAEAVYELLDKEKISKYCAEALYMGIVHDTGVFKHSCTTRRTMEIAGRLIELGVDTAQIIDDTFYRKTYVQNQLLGRALLESQLLLEGKVIVSLIPASYFTFYGASKTDLEGIVDQLRITQGVEVAIFVYQSGEDAYKFSLRANTSVDVSKIAVLYGGGGHVRAAGCTMFGDYEESLKKIVAEITKQL